MASGPWLKIAYLVENLELFTYSLSCFMHPPKQSVTTLDMFCCGFMLNECQDCMTKLITRPHPLGPNYQLFNAF